MSVTRFGLFLTCCGVTEVGCSLPVPSELKELTPPKSAVIVTLEVSPNLKTWRGPLTGFWLDEGLADAPDLKLQLVQTNGRYRVDPLDTMLELRCEPFARGVIVAAGVVRLGMAPPTVAPGDLLTLEAGAVAAVGPVHPRTYGWTDTSIPGTFISANAIDLGQLARSNALTIRWGQRSASLPAPPPEMFASFASRCEDAFRFARRHE